MLNRLRGVLGASLMVSALSLGNAASAGAVEKAAAPTGSQTIVEIAVGDPSLSTLVTALVSLTPVNASNGVVYVIDSVLQPQFR
jgi:uncharacterized surface protein with fasciclin (FAS1) repeats